MNLGLWYCKEGNLFILFLLKFQIVKLIDEVSRKTYYKR